MSKPLPGLKEKDVHVETSQCPEFYQWKEPVLMEIRKTDKQKRFSSMLAGFRSKIQIMIVDAEMLDLITVEEDLKNKTGEKR